jgi:hypothetical protein
MEFVMALFRNPKAQHGTLAKIDNTDKKITENEEYYALYVEDLEVDNERCLLLSDGDLKMITEVKYSDFKQHMTSGTLYRMGNSESYFLRMNDLDKKDKVVKITQTIIRNGEERAKRNPEDVPQKGFFQDLLD